MPIWQSHACHTDRNTSTSLIRAVTHCRQCRSRSDAKGITELVTDATADKPASPILRIIRTQYGQVVKARRQASMQRHCWNAPKPWMPAPPIKRPMHSERSAVSPQARQAIAETAEARLVPSRPMPRMPWITKALTALASPNQASPMQDSPMQALPRQAWPRCRSHLRNDPPSLPVYPVDRRSEVGRPCDLATAPFALHHSEGWGPIGELRRLWVPRP